MKIKDLISIIEDTDFVCRRNAYSYDDQFKTTEGTVNSKLSEFGYWEFAFGNGGQRDFIIIEKDYKIFKSYNKLSDLLDDEEVMEMEIIKIKNITLLNDYRQSSTPTNWPNNKSKIEICVR